MGWSLGRSFFCELAADWLFSPPAMEMLSLFAILRTWAWLFGVTVVFRRRLLGKATRLFLHRIDEGLHFVDLAFKQRVAFHSVKKRSFAEGMATHPLLAVITSRSRSRISSKFRMPQNLTRRRLASIIDTENHQK
jgi:hypothetical protein